MRVKKIHPFQGLIEPLMEHPAYVQKAMFGCQAIYVDELLTLVLASGEEPWNGILVATAREHHDSLRHNYPALIPHPVLGKWLYLSAKQAEFESVACALVERVRRADPRIGVAPKARRRPRKRVSR